MKTLFICIFTILMTITSVTAQSATPQNLKIHYSEYHASSNMAHENESERSLADYVQKFEVTNNVEIKDRYRVSLTDDSGAYFFSLKHLTENQRLNFISGRLVDMDEYQINRAFRMTLNKPKKLSVYVKAISADVPQYILWNPSDNGIVAKAK